MRRIISLLTDFGDAGPYVGAMRGVLVSLCPDARLVDISHAVAPHDVAGGAFVLAAAAPFFPRGTVHLAVVDPGVGSARRAIAIAADGHLFVGPDNGLLLPAARRAGPPAVFEIDPVRVGAGLPHPTFHGRDLFAPAAARLALGHAPASLGPRADDPFEPGRTEVGRAAPGCLALRVLFVDRFGNVTLDLAERDARRPAGPPPWIAETAGGAHPVRPATTYSGAAPGELLLLAGSSGWMELALDRRSAAALLRVGAGDRVTLRPGR